MIKNDKQLGFPFTQYADTKANIEALVITGSVGGETAYATDDKQLGTYNGISWDWLVTGSYSGVTGSSLVDHEHSATGDGGQLDPGVAFANQTGNTVLASPADGASGPSLFRKLVSADLPNSPGGLTYVTANVSNPPTHAELVTTLGNPIELATQGYVLVDSNTGYAYFVVSNGLTFYYMPLNSPYYVAPEEPEEGSGTIWTIMGGGAWCWFADPRAVYYNGKAYIGAVCDDRTIYVRAFIYSSQTVSAGAVLHTMPSLDDHDNPGILVRYSDKKIMAFYSHHVGTSLYMRVSSNAENTESWDTEVNLDNQVSGSFYTYPSPVQLTGETNDPIYLFFRHHATMTPPNDYPAWSYTKSTDDGANWSVLTEFIKTTGSYSVYLKECANGTERIDFAVSNCHPNEGQSSIYHFYYQGGKWYKTDGTEITASLPFAPSNATLVYNGSTVKGWIWDVAVDGTGKPVIVYVTYPTYPTDIRYNYAHWTGAAWETHEIVAAGGSLPDGANADYAPGCYLDHSDITHVYLSKKVGSWFEIFKYSTADHGANWTNVALTTNSNVGVGCIRPISVRDYPASGLRVLWMKGLYPDYLSFDTNLFGTDI